ncbi:hypothetical protein BHE74_00020157, partial [Ensete ventricosum]
NSSLYSTSTCVFDPTCWNSSSAITPQSSCSKNLNMNMDFLAKDGNQAHVPYPCADPYFGGIFALCRPHAMVNSQVVFLVTYLLMPL